MNETALLADALRELDTGGDGESSYTFTGTIEELAADIVAALEKRGVELVVAHGHKPVLPAPDWGLMEDRFAVE